MPVRLCSESGCGETVSYRGRCPEHARPKRKELQPRKALYGSKRWRRLRENVLAEEPLCGCGRLTTDVDHIIAIEDGGNVWERANLQGLCGSCHAIKTSREIGARARGLKR